MIVSSKQVQIIQTIISIHIILIKYHFIGRFDQLIYVGPPDYWGRKHILEIFFKSLSISDSVTTEAILPKTDGFTGADLRSLCNQAGQAAITRDFNANSIDLRDFRTVLSKMKSSVSPNMISKYKTWKHYQSTF